MLDLNIDYLQSTQMYVSYTLKNLIRKIDNLWPPKDKKISMRLFLIVNANQNVAQMLIS